MILTQNQIQILQNWRIEDNMFFLQWTLDRKQYININEVLNTIGLIWNRWKKAHISDLSNEELKEALDDIIETGEVETLKETIKKFQFFPTPEELCYKMINELDIKEDDKILEPSAWLWNIVKCILNKYPARLFKLYINELDKLKVDELEKIDWINGKVINKDFLDFIWVMEYDKIIMNPPYSKKQDYKHIKKAIELLKDWWRIVWLISRWILFREDYKDLKEDIESHWYIEEIEAWVFKESWTMVWTCLIVYNK